MKDVFQIPATVKFIPPQSHGFEGSDKTWDTGDVSGENTDVPLIISIRTKLRDKKCQSCIGSVSAG